MRCVLHPKTRHFLADLLGDWADPAWDAQMKPGEEMGTCVDARVCLSRVANLIQPVADDV